MKYLANSQTGDSPQVLPLSASSHSLFLQTRMVSNEKGRQILKAVVSIFKKIRFPLLMERQAAEGFFAPGDLWWLLFCVVPPLCMFVALNLVRDPGLFLVALVLDGGYIINLITVVSVVYWYRDKPFRLIGAKMKFTIEVIPMIIAAAFRHLLEFNCGYLALTVGGSSAFYVYAHFMHASYDIGGIDVLLGLVMQVLVYTLNAKLSVRALVLSFCFGLCLYRYMTYRAPQLPVHRKKDLEQVPC